MTQAEAANRALQMVEAAMEQGQRTRTDVLETNRKLVERVAALLEENRELRAMLRNMIG